MLHLQIKTAQQGPGLKSKNVARIIDNTFRKIQNLGSDKIYFKKMHDLVVLNTRYTLAKR